MVGMCLTGKCPDIYVQFVNWQISFPDISNVCYTH